MQIDDLTEKLSEEEYERLLEAALNSNSYKRQLAASYLAMLLILGGCAYFIPGVVRSLNVGAIGRSVVLFCWLAGVALAGAFWTRKVSPWIFDRAVLKQAHLRSLNSP